MFVSSDGVHEVTPVPDIRWDGGVRGRAHAADAGDAAHATAGHCGRGRGHGRSAPRQTCPYRHYQRYIQTVYEMNIASCTYKFMKMFLYSFLIFIFSCK